LKPIDLCHMKAGPAQQSNSKVLTLLLVRSLLIVWSLILKYGEYETF